MKRSTIILAFLCLVFLVSCGTASMDPSSPDTPLQPSPEVSSPDTVYYPDGTAEGSGVDNTVHQAPGERSGTILPREFWIEGSDGNAVSVYEYLGNFVNATEAEFREVYIDKLNTPRSAEAFSTTMTPDEIRQHLAAEICGAIGLPPGCEFPICGGTHIVSCKCWVYDYAGVYHVYPTDLIGFIGIHGIFVTQYTDAEIDALADALYWMGYGLPPNGPPTDSPCPPNLPDCN